jgi:1,4-alpha-glucan branching enzyme
MSQGYLSLILHAHLPYVRHPEHERFLEEQWFYEALTETYIPLIKAFDSLSRDGVPFRLTMSLTPTLLSMMTDTLLQDRYVKHLERLIELAKKEVERTRGDSRFEGLARMYRDLFEEARHIFCDRYGRDLSRAFRYFADQGVLEIITCAASHGFLPLMQIQPEAIRAQIQTAVRTHERILGRRPLGIWLPECGFAPEIDVFLKEAGITFFIVDSHAIVFGSPRPKFGVFAPVYCQSGVAAFGRDLESSKSVWSAEEGYPGDFVYREFYRDIGFDLDYDYVRPYLSGDGLRTNTGIKYYRITGSRHKEPYDPSRAAQKAIDHAGNFLFNRAKQAEFLQPLMGQPPIIVSPYDAELYGHWWFEGPQWLEALLRKIHFDQQVIETITPIEYLRRHPRNQVVTPTLSSWGYNGYAEVWLNGSNDWIYRHLHKSAERMIESANHFHEPDDRERRVLNQMARELILAQSSDWAFIMKTGSHTSYAVNRTKDHLQRFTRLYEALSKKSIDMPALERIELNDNLFPDIDYRFYASAH